jgi:glutamate dehydrogenase/leucine dehydrogenase
MPKRIAGKQATARVFTGRICHVESNQDPQESSGVGVEFFYWEAP